MATSQTYDGLGVDSAINPYTLGSSSTGFYISNNHTTNKLTVLSGSLTFNANDYKVAVGGSKGTLAVGSGATLNINNIGQWSGAVDANWWDGSNPKGTLIISNNATVNWNIGGSSETRWLCGQGGFSSGEVDFYGGSLNVWCSRSPVTDGSAGMNVGQYGANGVINLYSGTFSNSMPLPCNIGDNGYGWGKGTMNISNGVYQMTGIFATDPNYPTKASFNIIANSGQVNFIPGGNGSLSLTNWDSADYATLVANGQILIAGALAPFDDFAYSSVNGQGILKLASVVALAMSPSPSNTVNAGTPLTLQGAIYGGPSPTVRWQTDNGSGGVTWSDIPGATTANYVLNTTGLTAGTYEYQLIATSGSLSVTSLVETVTMNSASAPVFALDANSQDVTPNDTIDGSGAPLVKGSNSGFTLTCYGATGTLPITYQWQISADNVSWSNLNNRTNLTIAFNSLQLSDSGYYRIIASNSVGLTTNSSVVDLTVQNLNVFYTWSVPTRIGSSDSVLTNPPGNYLAGAMVAENGGSPISVTNGDGSIIVFAAANNWCGISGGNGFSSGFNTNLTGNSSFDSALNLGYYDGNSHTITLNGLVVGNHYQVKLFALDDRSASYSSHTISWQDPLDSTDVSSTYSMAANDYIIATFTATNTSATIQENVLTGSGNFNCLVLNAVGWTPAPYFVQEPAAANGFQGQTASFTGLAAGDVKITSPAITYHWAVGPVGGPYNNLVEGSKYVGTTTTTLTITSLTASDASSVYVLKAMNGGGTSVSAPAALVVQPVMPPTPGSYGASVLSNNPVAFWQFNETNDPSIGGVLAYDYSGHGNYATYGTASQNIFTNASWLSPQPPEYPGFASGQGALDTSVGVNNSYATSPVLNLNTNAVTICMWINPSANVPTYTGLFFTRGGSDGAAGLGFGGSTQNGSAELGYTWNNNNANTWGFNSGLYPPVGVWSFVALVVQSNQATLYVCNVNNGTTNLQSAVNAVPHTVQQFNNAGNIWIGSNNGNSGPIFPGLISDVAVYQSSLKSAQILQLFGTGLGAQVAPSLMLAPQVVNNNGVQQLVLSWDQPQWGTLLQATNLLGPWTSSGATSPYTNSMTGGQMFFKLSNP